MRSGSSVLFEALLIALIGGIFGLGANALSPRGLRLTRNYFPGAPNATPNAPSPAHRTNAAPSYGSEGVLARLQQRGLQIVTSNEVSALFQDAGHQQGLIVFIDARNDAAYQSGHVPGAWQFDHYHAEKFLPMVLPVCLNAEKVVVYCNGGECEDSEFAALTLRETGVPAQKIYIYAAGITEWKANRQPLETGERGSGAVSQ